MSDAPVDVAVLQFPQIGEQQEFDELFADASARCRWVSRAEDLGTPGVIVLPGSEKTMQDLAWMRDTGLLEAVRLAHGAGAVLVGICGGFQILGTLLQDPERLEEGDATGEGLGLLPVRTTFVRDPVEEPTVGVSTGALLPSGTRVSGREIHGGRSVLEGDAVAIFGAAAKGGGACPLGIATPGLDVIGTYLHDVLADAAFRARVLALARERRGRS